MKKVKCIKDTIGFSKGRVYETINASFLIIGNPNYIPLEQAPERYPEYFQEVKEEETKNPRWKVGDYIVREFKTSPPNFIKVYQINMDTYGNNPKWKYNGTYEGEFRDPTPAEMKIYFR